MEKENRRQNIHIYSTEISVKHECVSVNTFSDKDFSKKFKLKSRKILQ